MMYIMKFLTGMFIGFFVGILLAELIGVVAYLSFGQIIGIKYFSVFTAILFGFLALIWESKRS